MNPRSFHDGKVVVHAGDCMEILRELPADSIDAVVTDPPYHLTSIVKRFGKPGSAPVKIKLVEGQSGSPFARGARGFMGKEWDGGDIAFTPELWAEVLRVLKPGGFLAAMGGDRTVHRLACAIEDAGFDIRGQCAWIFGSGFPKSLNVSRALSALPWCSCGCRQETLASAEFSVPPNKDSTTANADPGISSSGTLSINSGSTSMDTCLPLGASGTGVGTESVTSPADGSTTLQARRLGNKLSRGSRHRRAIVDSGIKKLVGNLSPVVLGPPDVAAVTEYDEIRFNVPTVQDQPETLRDQMVCDELAGSPTVLAGSVPVDDSYGDIFPSSSLVGPFTSSPSGIPVSREPVAVGDSHAALGAINRSGVGCGKSTEHAATDEACVLGCAALELHASGSGESDSLESGRTGSRTKSAPIDPGDELSPTVLAAFGNHAKLLRSLVSESNISVCAKCGWPIKPEWLIDGLGTALKPAMELVVLARKPLSEPTVAANVFKHGVGALNIDKCRVESEGGTKRDGEASQDRRYTEKGATNFAATPGPRGGSPAGRWPANLIHDGSPEVLAGFPESNGAAGTVTGREPSTDDRYILSGLSGNHEPRIPRGDSGSAARFFYQAKADADDRLNSKHPTVKPVDLIAWLVRLICPKNGTVLDPFAGTGTTGAATFREGCRAVLIEREEEYLADIERRMELLLSGPDERSRKLAKADPHESLPLFGAV